MKHIINQGKKNSEVYEMSMYNLANGFNPACVLVMPMLGRKQDEWPRFRDCFVTDDKNIAIYTRVGGNNRNCGYGEEELYKAWNTRAPILTPEELERLK